MQTEPVLIVSNIMSMFRISQPTVYRWLVLSRKGAMTFPLPINGYKQKLLWNLADVGSYHHRQARNENTLPPVMIAPAKQKRLQRKQREATTAVLERHGIRIKKTKFNRLPLALMSIGTALMFL